MQQGPGLLAGLLLAGLAALFLWARRRFREPGGREPLAHRVLDLTRQLAARTDQLRESEARIQGFLRHAPAAIAIKGLDGRLLLLNRRAEALVGLFQAVTPDARCGNLLPADSLLKGREQDARLLTRGGEAESEEAVTLADGSVRAYRIQKFPLLDPPGRCWGLGVIAMDISRRRQDEQVRLQQQKREALSLLAGGIAHDFNNILGAMLGNVELARLELGPLEHLATLEELLHRATDLVAQVLAYAGSGHTRIEPLDLNLQVEAALRLLRASPLPKAVLQWDPAPDLPFMEGDGPQIKQALLNLVINALEAVPPGGGRVRLRSGCERLAPGVHAAGPQGPGLEPGQYLTLEVLDNGPGMSTEVQERLFDPFFTTKATGRGLGLSAVQGIARSHGGGVLVRSTPGQGSSFKLFLPVLAAPGLPLEPDPRDQAVDFRGSGTVLVVDDEEPLRAVAMRALWRMGFEVLEAADGMEAVAVYEANWARIRLILLDLTMPRMGGEEAYRELRRAGALAPIVLSSGMGPEEALRRFRGMALAGFLQKPYRLRTFSEVLRNAMEGLTCTADRSGKPPRELVAWIPEFETGHALLDAQHKGILRAFNRLVAGVEEATGPERALALLMEALAGHYATEEGLMRDAGYARTGEHATTHARVLESCTDLARRLGQGEAALDPAALNALEDALLNHLQGQDRDLARHLGAAPG